MQIVAKDVGYEYNDRMKVAQDRDYFGALVKR